MFRNSRPRGRPGGSDLCERNWSVSDPPGRPKTGFRLPLDQWFRTDLKEFARDRLLSDDPVFHRMIDKNRLEGFLKRYFDTSIDYSDHVWALLWMQEWLLGQAIGD